MNKPKFLAKEPWKCPNYGCKQCDAKYYSEKDRWMFEGEEWD